MTTALFAPCPLTAPLSSPRKSGRKQAAAVAAETKADPDAKYAAPGAAEYLEAGDMAVTVLWRLSAERKFLVDLRSDSPTAAGRRQNRRGV